MVGCCLRLPELGLGAGRVLQLRVDLQAARAAVRPRSLLHHAKQRAEQHYMWWVLRQVWLRRSLSP